MQYGEKGDEGEGGAESGKEENPTLNPKRVESQQILFIISNTMLFK